MLMVGLAFKLSAVPFHFWCPDVFEGASAEVNAFLVGRFEGGGPGAVGARGDRFQRTLPRSRWLTNWPSSPSQPWSPAATAVASDAPSPTDQAVAKAVSAKQSNNLAGVAALHRRPDRLAGCHHLHVRQSDRLRSDEYQTAAGLFDDRACRLHDDAGGRRRGPDGRTSGCSRAEPSAGCAFYVGVYLFMNLGSVRHCGLPAQRHAE